MTKYLLLIGLAFFVWWLWRKARASRAGSGQRPRAIERMVQCAHCGVNQPITESILADGRYFCCAAHLRESESADG